MERSTRNHHAVTLPHGNVMQVAFDRTIPQRLAYLVSRREVRPRHQASALIRSKDVPCLGLPMVTLADLRIALARMDLNGKCLPRVEKGQPEQVSVPHGRTKHSHGILIDQRGERPPRMRSLCNHRLGAGMHADLPGRAFPRRHPSPDVR